MILFSSFSHLKVALKVLLFHFFAPRTNCLFPGLSLFHLQHFSSSVASLRFRKLKVLEFASYAGFGWFWHFHLCYKIISGSVHVIFICDVWFLVSDCRKRQKYSWLVFHMRVLLASSRSQAPTNTENSLLSFIVFFINYFACGQKPT